MKVTEIVNEIYSGASNESPKENTYYVCFWNKVQGFDDVFYRESYLVTAAGSVTEVVAWMEGKRGDRDAVVALVYGDVSIFPAPPTSWIVLAGSVPEVAEGAKGTHGVFSPPE